MNRYANCSSNFSGPGRLNIAAITSKDIAELRDKRHALGLAPLTVNLDITILSSAFNAAWKQGHVSVNPCLAVEPLKDKKKHRKGIFTPEQVSVLVKTARGDLKGLVMAGFYLGARLNDIANLKWENVDLVSKIKTVRFQPRKGGGEIVAVIHPALEDYLLTLPAPEKDDAYLFPSLAQRAVSTLSKEFGKLMEEARIEQRIIREKSGAGRNVHELTFHSLRHSFSSILANAGVSEERRINVDRPHLALCPSTLLAPRP